jgi:hypothetical protein|nr:MAG TPA: hypothetical protein [Myoviridae sp. ctfuG5]
MSNTNIESNSDSNKKFLTPAEFASQEYSKLLETINQAEKLNTLDVFALNPNTVRTIVYQVKRNARLAFGNLTIFDQKEKLKLSRQLASYLDLFLYNLNRIQTVFYNSSNLSDKNSPKSSYIFETWRLFLILSREITILTKSVNHTNIGLALNWDHGVEELTINYADESTNGIRDLFERDVTEDINLVKAKLYGVLSRFNNYHHRYYIHEGKPTIFKPYGYPEHVERAYDKTQKAHDGLGKIFTTLESVNSLNHLSLKMRTLELLEETLKNLLKVVESVDRLIDVDPLLVIKLYLEKNPNLDSNIKEIASSVGGLMELLIKKDGVIDESDKVTYRDVYKRLTNLPCGSKSGETLSILEIDKMNLVCFNKIPNLTSFDLIMLDALKGLFIKLSYTFNWIYDEEFKKTFSSSKNRSLP